MANRGIVANQIAYVPLELTVNGAVVPTPPGDAFTVVSSAPTKMSMTIGPDPTGATPGTGIIITCLVTESDPGNGGGGFTGTVSDTNGDLALTTEPYDITLVPVVPSITAAPITFSLNPNPPTAPGP